MTRKRNRDARRAGARPLGDLERYGVLALIAACALAIAYAAQALAEEDSPAPSMAFAAGRDRGAPVASSPAGSPATAGELDEPGGGRADTASGGGAARDDFDFFEPPVRLPGRPPVEAPPPPHAGVEAGFVTIEPGDTLERIALRELGSRGRWRSILAANPGLDPRRLVPGDRLALPPRARAAAPAPPRDARVHEVRAKDTLESIALRWYGDRARWIDLLEANRDQLADPRSLRTGMRIRVP